MATPSEKIANTTQTPNLIFDVWIPLLKDVELRVLLIITRQTYGWIEDKETGMRKKEDWISHYQLTKKTGRSKRSISRALKILIDKHGIVQARAGDGRILDTPQLRMIFGERIFYRLDLKRPPATLFDKTVAKSAGVTHTRRQFGARQFGTLQNKPINKIRIGKAKWGQRGENRTGGGFSRIFSDRPILSPEQRTRMDLEVAAAERKAK